MIDVMTTAFGNQIAVTRILGIPVSLITMRTAVETITGWAATGEPNFVCIRDVHGVMRAQEDQELRAIHEQAGLVTPDGMPLVWVARRRGHKEVERVCGADLVAALCDRSQELGLRHYFFGGKPGVAERMAGELSRRFPGLKLAGCSTPPFRIMSPAEDEASISEITETRPHLIWVGLSTPKQEFWMRDHVGRIPGATLIGVGAAFDFYAGDVKRAPPWMQKSGLEWLHRLVSEPRRLWRRYLIMAPKFVVALATERVGR